jgi:hypothetical protein
MVRFFFDLAKNGVLSPDDTGLELAGDEAAKIEASKALAEMATALIGSDKGSIALLVRDDSGARVCTVTMALSVTY